MGEAIYHEQLFLKGIFLLDENLHLVVQIEISYQGILSLDCTLNFCTVWGLVKVFYTSLN